MRLPLLAALAAVAVLATIPAARAADVEANKKLVRTLIDDVMNKRQLDAVDRFLAPDFVEHNPNLPQGREGRKQFAAAVHAGFSDYRGEIVEILAEGDKVVVRTKVVAARRMARSSACRPRATRCASRPPTSSASPTARWPSIGTWSTSLPRAVALRPGAAAQDLRPWSCRRSSPRQADRGRTAGRAREIAVERFSRIDLKGTPRGKA